MMSNFALYHVQLSRPLVTSTTRASSGVSGRIIASASVGRPSSGATKPTWGSFSPPSARSSGTIQIAFPSPFQGRGSRGGGVVTVTSRCTKTRRMTSDKQYIFVQRQIPFPLVHSEPPCVIAGGLAPRPHELHPRVAGRFTPEPTMGPGKCICCSICGPVLVLVARGLSTG